MNRYPFLTLFFFVGLSMAIAVGYASFQQSDLESKIEGQESFAKAQSFSAQAKNVVREIANAGEVGTEELKSCQCVPRGRRVSGYLVREKETCAKETLAYQSEFEKMPAMFRERRASSAAEFPRICLVRILNSAEQNILSDKKCANHAPICVTEEYVNVLYNLYADVFSCFDLPQKEILPWFQVNGGFHLNAKNGVSGLQSTSAEAEKYFQKSIESLSQNQEASCQRLLPFAQKMKLHLTDECFQISPPENPLLSFLIFATPVFISLFKSAGLNYQFLLKFRAVYYNYFKV